MLEGERGGSASVGLLFVALQMCMQNFAVLQALLQLLGSVYPTILTVGQRLGLRSVTLQVIKAVVAALAALAAAAAWVWSAAATNKLVATPPTAITPGCLARAGSCC